jgi:membrane protease YdiL (CAAX protease family)
MNLKKLIQRYPATSYFITAFFISWAGAFILVAPKLFSGQPIPKMDGILMFPIMIIGPAASSIILTALTEGKAGLQNLRSRMGKWKVPGKWYIISFLIPPCLVTIVLLLLRNFVSPVFTPQFFVLGFLFGIPAGFFEEIGWTGYAFPKLRLSHSFIKSGLILGLLWGLWHLPVIDFLGAASPHGDYLLPFALAFIAAMAAIRIIIVWIYSYTNSTLLAQFMHAVSTGSLVIFGPPKVSSAQETLWYALYAVALWMVILIAWRLRAKKQPGPSLSL